jgi:putative ABC transport system permease protein
MGSISYSTAARIATRELRSSPGKFAFVLLSVAVGVAALTGVRGFSSSFRSMLLLRARSIMAADIAARMMEPPMPSEQASLDKIQGLDATPVTEMLSMASSTTSLDPLLVALKAVDPANTRSMAMSCLSPPFLCAKPSRIRRSQLVTICCCGFTLRLEIRSNLGTGPFVLPLLSRMNLTG